MRAGRYNIVCVYGSYYTVLFLLNFVVAVFVAYDGIAPFSLLHSTLHHEQMNLLIGFGCEFNEENEKDVIANQSRSSPLCDTGHPAPLKGVA